MTVNDNNNLGDKSGVPNTTSYFYSYIWIEITYKTL